MTNPTPSISIRQAARIAGFAYLAVFILATLANSFALEKRVLPS